MVKKGIECRHFGICAICVERRGCWEMTLTGLDWGLWRRGVPIAIAMAVAVAVAARLYA